jgi:hypothetical protein
MLLAGEPNIREVVLFPMNQRAEDLMMNAPGEVTQRQLRELHIRIVPPPAPRRGARQARRARIGQNAHAPLGDNGAGAAGAIPARLPDRRGDGQSRPL